MTWMLLAATWPLPLISWLLSTQVWLQVWSNHAISSSSFDACFPGLHREMPRNKLLFWREREREREKKKETERTSGTYFGNARPSQLKQEAFWEIWSLEWTKWKPLICVHKTNLRLRFLGVTLSWTPFFHRAAKVARWTGQLIDAVPYCLHSILII